MNMEFSKYDVSNILEIPVNIVNVNFAKYNFEFKENIHFKYINETKEIVYNNKGLALHTKILATIKSWELESLIKEINDKIEMHFNNYEINNTLVLKILNIELDRASSSLNMIKHIIGGFGYYN